MEAAHDALVGRATEQARVDAALDRVDARTSTAIAVVGEPGIGKSSLLADLMRKADDRRWLVVGSACTELDTHLPFAAFVDALDAYLGSVDPARLASLGPDALDDLRAVFPSLARAIHSATSTPPPERYRTNRAVGALISALASEQPLAIVLDDLHWGDPASVDLAATLLVKPLAAPVLLALGMRPRQMPSQLVASLDRAVRAGSTDRIDLDTLERRDIEAMLGGDVGSGDVDRIYDDSGGNPFYARQLARAVQHLGPGSELLPRAVFAELSVPAVVVAALGEELALLSDDARLVVNGAAVAGEPFDPELVADVSGAGAAGVLTALDEALRLDIIRPTGVPRRFRFRHPLVRRAVYESAPIAWRLGAHERCVHALQARGAPASARAHHVEQAGLRGDQAAVDTLREAGDVAAHHAPASAARWYEVAMQFLPVTASDGERVGLLSDRARALAGCGQFDASRSTLIECLELVPADHAARRVRLVAECASVEHQLGRHIEAHERMARALDELDRRDTAEAVSLMVALAVDSLYAGDFSVLQELVASVLDAADTTSDAGFTAAGRAVQAMALALEGQIERAVQRSEEAAALIDAMTDAELAPRLDALVHLTTAEMYLDRFDASRRHAERSLRIGRATGQLDLHPLIFPMLGTALWICGRLRESADVLDGAVEAARLTGNVQATAWYLFNRAEAHVAAGEAQAAIETATESVALMQTLDDSFIAAAGSGSLLSALAAAGQSARALETVRTFGGGHEVPLISGTWRVLRLEAVTRCLIDVGELQEAARIAAYAGDLADSYGLPMPAGMAALALGAVALANDDARAAVQHGHVAVAQLEAAGMVGDTARALLFAGRALAAAGDADAATAALDRARDVFARIGHARGRAEVEQELRRQGHSVHRRTAAGDGRPTGVGSLTEREREIADLVVDRRTNAQIAGVLFLSLKTVETHLRNIFRKLEVASRVDVARLIEHAGDDAGGAT
jgi:predicted ATPase/DNA-binding CsgD family transcriptional regulator